MRRVHRAAAGIFNCPGCILGRAAFVLNRPGRVRRAPLLILDLAALVFGLALLLLGSRGSGVFAATSQKHGQQSD